MFDAAKLHITEVSHKGFPLKNEGKSLKNDKFSKFLFIFAL